MPVEALDLLADLAHWMRTLLRGDGPKRGRGRPAIDIVDLAFVATMRFFEGWTYEELLSKIPQWAASGYIDRRFSYGRMVEAMTLSEHLSYVLDLMCLRIEDFFRDIATIFVTDGVIFSTARTDHPKSSHFAGGTSVRVTCHSQYEQRWGLLTGFRVTWSQRGVGSGEAPQYPYLLRMTRRVFSPQFDLADAAFSTDRNFAFADSVGVRLISPINPTQFLTGTKRFLTPQRARFHLDECNMRDPGPLYKQLYTTRAKAEGWHEVNREEMRRYLVSRPDRNSIPSTRAEDTKKYPGRSYVGLPIDQEERDLFIDEHQVVGRAVINEIQARRLGLHLRALVKASRYYAQGVDFFRVQPFVGRPEDAAFSPFRKRGIAA